MEKICLAFLASESFECLSTFESAFREVGFDVEAITIPNFWLSELGRKKLRRLKSLLRQRSNNRRLIFSPQSTEIFLKEPDFSLLYSGYRSWFDDRKMRVIPHLWTPIRGPEFDSDLSWGAKPPLRVGFMGRLHSTSRLATAALKFPFEIKKRLLEGRYLKRLEAIALMNDFGFSIAAINAFARIETIRVLQEGVGKHPLMHLDCIEKSGFYGSESELNEYTNHLERNTYIVCPRGTENYSFRLYEALSRGRIPVIIDTDVVLPKEINWNRLSVRVPYGSLDSISEIILHDYESHSEAEFVGRQKEALSTMAELRTMRWVTDLANEWATGKMKWQVYGIDGNQNDPV